MPVRVEHEAIAGKPDILFQMLMNNTERPVLASAPDKDRIQKVNKA